MKCYGFLPNIKKEKENRTIEQSFFTLLRFLLLVFFSYFSIYKVWNKRKVEICKLALRGEEIITSSAQKEKVAQEKKGVEFVLFG